MLKKITRYFEQFINPETSSAEQKQHALNLAVAAIMLEMVGMDSQVSDTETHAYNQLLSAQLELKPQEISDLQQMAQKELTLATDYYQFTRLINDHFDGSKKREIIEGLWRIAYADGKIDSFEEHYLRKICDLLFVPHSEFIKAKLRVLADS